MGMAIRIGPKKPRILFLAEWREKKGLTQAQAGDRVGVTSVTVSRWERAARGEPTAAKNKPNIDVLAALGEAYGIDPGDFYYHPDQPSPDALLRDKPPAIREQAIKLIKALAG
jgi:transcriptional regulator with XRE-family HTH domain